MEKKEKKKKDVLDYPYAGSFTILGALRELGLKGKKLWIVSFLFIITVMLIAALLAIYA